MDNAPDPVRVSLFRIFSKGIVARNKNLDSDLIEVTPTEELPFLDGEVSSNLTEHEVEINKSDGSSDVVKTQMTVTLEAKWLRLGSSLRRTAPDVRRGEEVLLFTFGDTGKYYWTEMVDAADKLRKLETVVFAISAHTEEDQETTPDNSYYIEWSSHRQHLTLHTSKANGEPYAYDFQLDMKEGQLLFQDDIGNFLHIHSPTHRFQLQNTDGSHYDMHGKNLTITIPETIKMVCKDMVVNASNSITTTTTTDKLSCQTTTTQCDTATMNASSQYSLSTTQANMSGSAAYSINTMALSLSFASMSAAGGGSSISAGSGGVNISSNNTEIH